MIQIEFDYNQIITVIQANLTDTFDNILNKYIQKVQIKPDSVNFLANGKKLDINETIENQMSQNNKANNIFRIIVICTEKEEDIKIKSKDIICPICYESCKIKIENGKFKLYDCINDHITDNIKIEDFQETQKINISKIICDECNENNMGNTYNHEFYKCLTCNKNICLLCKSQNKHEQNHYLIKYEQKNYICKKHNDFYVKYCNTCQTNICISCDDEHTEHDTIFFGKIVPKQEEIKNKIEEIKSIKELFADNTKRIIQQLNQLINQIDLYYKIITEILTNFDLRNKNYDILCNIYEITTKNEIFNALDFINKTYNLDNIIDLYNKINLKKEELDNMKIFKKYNNNQMSIVYKINKFDEEIQLFGEGYENSFVENNKENCYLLINGNKHQLCKKIKLSEDQKKNETLEIKLIEEKPIIYMSHLFDNCYNLISLPDISNWNTKFVTSMNNMFYYCKSLISLPDLSNWDTSRVIDMSNMFYHCHSLKALPGISNWETKNVKDMSNIFYYCKSLESLPDISNWNTKNVKDMKYMFYYCKSLKSLPNISKWDTSNVILMNSMFGSCISLLSLPDISKWETNNVINMDSMFYNCNLLKSLPDISNWDTKNVDDISHMFERCSSLISLPNLEKWKLKKKIKKKEIFEGINSKIIPKGFKGCIIY